MYRTQSPLYTIQVQWWSQYSSVYWRWLYGPAIVSFICTLWWWDSEARNM